ncbi:hypothetical protein D3C71_2041110 [compost metagenome]
MVGLLNHRILQVDPQLAIVLQVALGEIALYQHFGSAGRVAGKDRVRKVFKTQSLGTGCQLA